VSKLIYTKDLRFIEILKTLEKVAASKASILLFGESGTGKELLSNYIHSKSNRSLKSFVAINCAAVPENLLESELFGYEKGAFTGADSRKIGKFEIANNGTLLLDEIGEMPLPLQAKLLRVLQENEIERLGSTESIKINVRIISATNKQLFQMVKNGKFREDLYYRLNVIPISIPPLRERFQDIEYLSRIFTELVCTENQIPLKTLSPLAIKKLLSWSWPGNIRELQNTMERSVLMAVNQILDEKDIIINDLNSSNPSNNEVRAGMTVEEAEKALILKTLEFTNQNRTHAAQMLGISIRTLRNKINIYSKQGDLYE
jgi:two-component system response regulator FlrC